MRRLAASGILLLAALAVAGGSPAAAAEPSAESRLSEASVEIGRIEVTGITVFAQNEIEGLLEVSPGDHLERTKVVRTAENLQELYRMRGYERVSIQSRITRRKNEEGVLESILEFAVSEGKPTRISAIHFSPDSIREEAFNRYWKSVEAGLAAKIALHPGEIYNQQKITTDKRAIQDMLVSEEFIGAKVDEIRVTDASAPADVPAESAARWVNLDFRIDLGDRVAFGFRGNTALTQVRLSALVDEQRVLGFGKDYIGAIRSRIEDEYRSEGYAQVKVTAYTSERRTRQERHVTYEIQEGPRVTLEEIDFDGNSIFTATQLRTQFLSRASTLLDHGYYVEKDVQRASDFLIEWMKSNGYLAAKLVTITTVPVLKPKRAGVRPVAVRIVVYLFEGDQTIVHSAAFKGMQAFTPEEAKHFLGLQESNPLNLFTFSEGIEALKAAYRAKGYLGVRILNEGTENVVKYSDDNRVADILLEIAEGSQFRVSAVQIEGLVQTREAVVRRELTFKIGEVLSETALADGEARLRRLGIFSLVTLRLLDDPGNPEGKIVRISLQEGTPGVVAGGPGFRTDLGARVFGQLAYTNLWGLNHTLSLTANANRRIENFRFVEYQSQLTYLYPWFLLDEVLFRPTFTVSGTQYIAFDATTITAAVTWEKRLFRNPNITALFTYSLEQVQQFSAADEVDNRRMRIGAIIPTLRLDTRDNPLSPTTGWYVTGSWEFASPLLFSQSDPFPVGYSRIQGRIDRLLSITQQVTLFLSYRGGFERSSEAAVVANSETGAIEPGSGVIPLIKQFALGGAGSLRGFTDQQLNQYNTSIFGTLSYSNYRAQLDLPFAGALRFGPFVDAANLLVDNRSVGMFFFDSLRVGVGFGLHYQTPVGPVNLDIGFNPSPRFDPNTKKMEDASRIYFSIGLI